MSLSKNARRPLGASETRYLLARKFAQDPPPQPPGSAFDQLSPEDQRELILSPPMGRRPEDMVESFLLSRQRVGARRS